MQVPRGCRVFKSAMILVLCSSGALGQSGYETSKDGHYTVQLMHTEARIPIGHSVRGGHIPFGLVPDQSIELRRQVGGLQIADFDQDGNNDLVVGCYTSNSFPPYEDWHDMIFFGTGSGISSTPGWLAANEDHTGDVLIGDLDGNGWMDIVTINGQLRRDSVRVYSNGPGGMSMNAGYVSNTTNTSWGTSGVLADMDQDGDLDLVTTNQGVSPNPFRPMLMFDNVNGILTSSSVWQSAEESIQNGIDARDITGDGYPDLGVAKWVNWTSGIYYNTTGVPDTFQSLFSGSIDADKGAAFADLEGDQNYELAIGGGPTRVYSSVHGALLQVYEAQPPFSGSQEVHFVDVDDDGDEDLAEVHFSDGRAHIYLNRGGVLDVEPTWTYDASEVGTAMAFGDLNGDGHTDMAVGYSGNTCVRVFFGVPQDCQADFTDDGVLDVFDVFAFVSGFNAEDPDADINSDGVFDVFDVFGFVEIFNIGCV